MKNTNMCSLHEELPKSAVWKTRVHFYSQTLNFKQHLQCQHNVLWAQTGHKPDINIYCNCNSIN